LIGEYIERENNGRFKKGCLPWNKGKYGLLVHSKEAKQKISDGNRGKKRSDEVRHKLAEAKFGEKNPMWKGNDVLCDALHEWIKSHKPKPTLCERCGNKFPYDLANISGEYKRDINDFEWICRRCHMNDDGRMKNLKQYKTKEYVCPNCGHEYLRVSSHEDNFYCGHCHVRWLIKKKKK
jgi:ribosomal protein S27AE